jgi:hypothetical protein
VKIRLPPLANVTNVAGPIQIEDPLYRPDLSEAENDGGVINRSVLGADDEDDTYEDDGEAENENEESDDGLPAHISIPPQKSRKRKRGQEEKEEPSGAYLAFLILFYDATVVTHIQR